MIRQTSLMAYSEVKRVVGVRQQLVLSAILSLGVATDKQLAKFLQWPINCVTPRRGELVKLGRVKELGTVDQDGRSVMVWCGV